MPEPIVAATKPCLVDLVAGRTYYWCACGRSARQPFCDGSHKGTGIEPLAFKAEESGDALLCACKQTRGGPWCDGSHNALSDSYGAPMDAAADAESVTFVETPKGARAQLDGDCFVLRPGSGSRIGRLRMQQTIGPEDGARHISQFAGQLEASASPVLRFADSDTALFVVSGAGKIGIGTQTFDIAPHSGAYIRAGEAFRLIADRAAPLFFNISVCPLGPLPEILDEMPAHFDASVPVRVIPLDPAKRSAMADRFYQVLVDGEGHGTEVTQFIGHIPLSRAAHHRHLYEETLLVLSGDGIMWTDRTKASVQAGDIIFLPRKQSHSVECTSPEGMLLVGVFYPSMSPAINY